MAVSFSAEWVKFKHDVIHKNRYFFDSPVLEKIKDLSNERVFKLQKNRPIYRARMIKKMIYGKMRISILKNHMVNPLKKLRKIWIISRAMS